MKWLIFVVALAAVVPVAGWLRNNPRQQPYAWMLLGCTPFLLSALPNLEIAPIGWPAWQGMTKGLEISAFDLLAVAIYVGLPKDRRPLPFRVPMAFYFSAVLLSALFAPVPFATLFYAWQIARMFLIYAVITRASSDERVVPALLKGMALGLCLEVGLTLWERAHGALQAGGSFGHQNLLGEVSHFVVFPFFALLLAAQPGWQPLAIPLGGAVIAVLTASRATLGLEGIGFILLFAISAARKWTARKAQVALLGGICIAVLGTLAVSSLESRFSANPLDDTYDERGILMTIAENMLSDYPTGVGANNFVTVGNLQGYDERAGIAWTSRSAVVHNVYWLAAAETGYLGVIALVILLFRPMATAYICGWRTRRDPRGDLLLGFGTSLIIVYIHSYFEWIFFTQEVQYMFAMTTGMVAGLAQKLGYWRVQSHRVPLEARGFVSPTLKIPQN